MKLYGKVLAVKASPKGIYYAKLDDLNKEGSVITICSGTKENSFGEVELKEGMRVAGNLKEVKSTKLVQGKLKVYKDHPKKGDSMKPMLFGNAVNVATNLCDKSYREGSVTARGIYETAVEVYTESQEVRSELQAEYPDMTASNLGAKLGDAMKRAACYTETVEDMLKLSKEFFALQVEYENSI